MGKDGRGKDERGTDERGGERRRGRGGEGKDAHGVTSVVWGGCKVGEVKGLFELLGASHPKPTQPVKSAVRSASHLRKLTLSNNRSRPVCVRETYAHPH